MAHGGHGKRRGEAGKLAHGANKRLLAIKSGKKQQKKRKMGSIKNQMRSIQRLLMKDNLSAEVKDVQHKRLEELKKQADQNQRAELERKMSLRYRRVKFFERRKIERAIKRLERVKEAGSEVGDKESMTQDPDTIEQLAQLKEDLEYVRFFPKTEKYVSLFMGQDDEEVIAKRNKLRDQIKVSLAAAEATGVELDEMESDEDQAMEVSDNDDFFLAGSSGDDVEADGKQSLTSSKSEKRRDYMAKQLPVSRSMHASGQKDSQQYQERGNSSSRLQFHDQRHHSSGKSYKYKKLHFEDERHQNQMGMHKSRKQRTTMSQPPLSGGSIPRYGQSQSASFNTPFRIASSTLLSKNHGGPSSVASSSMNLDGGKKLSKKPLIPEVHSSNPDAPKKRKRKHQPKKKKKKA